MSNSEPHDYGCSCKQCKAIAAAIVSRSADGTYFFTDDELVEMFGQ